MFHRSTAVKAEESANLIPRAELIGVVGARCLKSCRSNPASANVQGAAQVWRRGISPVCKVCLKVHALNGGRAGCGYELTIKREDSRPQGPWVQILWWQSN